MNGRPEILLFAGADSGGSAEYIYCQARALQAMGRCVSLLCTPSYLAGRVLPFPSERLVRRMPGGAIPKWRRRPWQVFTLFYNMIRLGWCIGSTRPKLVLMDDYREYLAPFWAWALSYSLRRAGAICAANVHDPVRDFIVGPLWWHRWSVQAGYSFISIALTHSEIPREAVMPGHIRRVVVSHGIYDLSAPSADRKQLRHRFGAPPESCVFLAFGFLRDNKNLDLLVKALPEVPEAFLLIAGQPQSRTNRPMSFYRDLARGLGVEARCHFHETFVPDSEVGDFFGAADVVALTYAASFHSQSGVINLAAAARVPVLASAAAGPLTEVVRRHNLGVIVKPDRADEVVRGMQAAVKRNFSPRWEEYCKCSGWDANIRSLLEAAGMLH